MPTSLATPRPSITATMKSLPSRVAPVAVCGLPKRVAKQRVEGREDGHCEFWDVSSKTEDEVESEGCLKQLLSGDRIVPML